MSRRRNPSDNMLHDMGSALVYVRVSTDEQASKVHNLPTQQRKCTDRSTPDGLTVAEHL
jgi:hypothetical protein